MENYVTKNNLTVKITKDAEIDGTHDEPYYKGFGVDAEGNEYYIIWDIKEGVDVENIEDNSDACDWENPREIVKL